MSESNQNPNQKKLITKFIQKIGEKNYSEANDYLKKTIENKLLGKINQYKNINIFRDE